MKTRTLLLLAIGCGLAILIAGGIQLLRLGGQDQTSTLLTVGETGRAGDVSVALLSADVVSPDGVVVTVQIGGADDPHGFDGFTLVGPGKVASVAASTCSGIGVSSTECSLRFSAAGMEGSSRQLIFRRADTQLRWVLSLEE